MKKIITKLLAEECTLPERKKSFDILVEQEITEELLLLLIQELKKFQTMNFSFPEALDIVWTWWSGLPRINTSTICSLHLANMWVPITKHWSNAASGRFGSADLLSWINYRLDQSKQEIEQQYKEQGMVFLYAKQLFPVMRHVAQFRKEHGRMTLFNLVWPLLCPWENETQIIGCSQEKYQLLMARVAIACGRKRVAVVRWQDGLDEITLTWPTRIIECDHEGEREFTITPEDLWYQSVPFKEIASQSEQENITYAKSLLNWTCQSAHKDLIWINCAFALYVMSKAKDLGEGRLLFDQYYNALSKKTAK